MVRALHLSAICGDDSDCRLVEAKSARDPPRALQSGDMLSGFDPFDRLARAVRHPDQRAGADTFQTMIAALPLLVVVRILEPCEFDQALSRIRVVFRRRNRQLPLAVLARISSRRAEQLVEVLHELLGLVLMLSKNDASLVLRDRQSSNQIRLAAAGAAAEADDVGRGRRRHELRAGIGVEDAVVGSEQLQEFGALLLGQILLELRIRRGERLGHAA